MQKSRWRTFKFTPWHYRTPLRRGLFTLILATLVAAPCARAEVPEIQRLPDTSDPSADSIYFAAGSTEIDPYAEMTVQRHATRLKALPDLYVTVVAHTDELGSASLELARGQHRLDAVRRLLEEARIQPSRIRTVNQGSEDVAKEPCADDECRRRRRRIDFIFHK